MSTQDAWALGIYDKYGVSLIDYFEAWGIKVSENIKYTIENGNYKNAFSMKDLVVDETIADGIKSDLGFDCDYKVVTNDELTPYNLKGSGKININIDDFSLIEGKYIYIKDGSKKIARFKIDSNTLSIPELPVGVYKLSTPELIGTYDNNAGSLIIRNNEETEFNLNYEKINSGINFENDVKVQFQGYYYNDAAEIHLVNDNSNLKLNFRYRGTTLFNCGLPADYEYAKIQVLDSKGAQVYEIPGNTEATFVVTEKGLKPEAMTEDEFYEEYTERMKTYIDAFVGRVTEDELYNRSFHVREK